MKETIIQTPRNQNDYTTTNQIYRKPSNVIKKEKGKKKKTSTWINLRKNYTFLPLSFTQFTMSPWIFEMHNWPPNKSKVKILK